MANFDKLGTIEKDKLADLLGVAGDPLQNISILRNKTKTTGIYINGQAMVS